jgi:hypothetical protein
VASEPTLIVQVPRGGGLARALAEQPPPSLASGAAVLEPGPTDALGNLEAPAAGQVVMSVPSPEALERDAEEVRRVIEHAGTGAEPLLVVVEVAEELREQELATVAEASARARRPVILRIVRDA